MAEIEIINETARRINKVFISGVVQKTIRLSGIRIKKASFSVIFASRAKIRSLNRAYRRKNEATDVLSFNYEAEYNGKNEKNIEGEIFLCSGIIAEQAKKNKINFDRELAFVLSHGVLHLLGMRHGKKMYELQDEVVSLIK
ncbi:MAG: rRNA maturation RNase YbeY [Candidatus Moranbacteria bacterium]|nr:rRNA maturation RNase YbeY [Candidatus Moranbacteria bacterium]